MLSGAEAYKELLGFEKLSLTTINKNKKLKSPPGKKGILIPSEDFYFLVIL